MIVPLSAHLLCGKNRSLPPLEQIRWHHSLAKVKHSTPPCTVHGQPCASNTVYIHMEIHAGRALHAPGNYSGRYNQTCSSQNVDAKSDVCGRPTYALPLRALRWYQQFRGVDAPEEALIDVLSVEVRSPAVL